MHTFVISAIIVLGVLIFVHEFGHFIIAKRRGVIVKRLSLGFGPKLVGKRIGETEYRISAIPLGGYVKLVGELPGEPIPPEEVPRSFTHQSIGRRASIIVAGPLFNFLFAALLFMLIFLLGFPVMTTKIGDVKPSFPAHKAGIKTGDRIVAVAGREVKSWEEMALAIRKTTSQVVEVKVVRGDDLLTFQVQPQLDVVMSPFGEVQKARVIGIMPAGEIRKEGSLNPLVALYRGLERTAKLTFLVVVAVIKLIQGVVPASDLGGPILIAKLAGESAKAGVISLLHFMAFLSINLAILNLLPIPVLDGGHLLFLGFEAILGRPVSLRKRELAHQVGFFLLVLLMVFVFYNDISRIFSTWFSNP